jgi:hypothetical protein
MPKSKDPFGDKLDPDSEAKFKDILDSMKKSPLQKRKTTFTVARMSAASIQI